MTPGPNGIQNPAAAPSAAGNLTYEEKVVRGHAGLDSLPGYVLAIFEKRAKGGAIFSRLIKPGEIFPSGFRIPFLDWSQKYFSVAVNDSVLICEFTHLVYLDDGNDEFTLNFHLTYRVADFRRVAEIWEHDPLRRLRDEIGRVIARNCARRKAEMFRERFRELERIVIAGEHGRPGKLRNSEEREPHERERLEVVAAGEKRRRSQIQICSARQRAGRAN